MCRFIMKCFKSFNLTLALLGTLTILASTMMNAQSKDSLRCSRIAQEHVRKQIKNENKNFKNMFVKACYDVSKTVTLVGVRTMIVSKEEEMYYNFIVTVNRENPRKPFISNVFSISDKKREELFNKPVSGE
jgi:hypothetical protein